MVKPREYVLASISVLLLIAIILVWRYPCLLSGNKSMLINVDYPGYSSFKEMTQSVDIIVVGRVESVYSRTWSDYPYTTFNVTVLQVAKPSTFNRSSVLVSQGGYHLDCRNADVSDNPLMNIGEEYVLFLIKGSNGDGTARSEFLPSVGGLSMFLVRDGRVYPRFESWAPSVSGHSLADVLNETVSYVG
jgi:hypothetical protein